jgi:hypothetical protein
MKGSYCANSKWSDPVYEAELARRRYLRRDPDDQLVADSLENWIQKSRRYYRLPLVAEQSRWLKVCYSNSTYR